MFRDRQEQLQQRFRDRLRHYIAALAKLIRFDDGEVPDYNARWRGPLAVQRGPQHVVSATGF